VRSLLILATRGEEHIPAVPPFRSFSSEVDVFTWDYTGTTNDISERPDWSHISKASPGGGISLGWQFEWALEQGEWDYVGIVSHDVHGLTPAGVQMMLDSARALKLACFAPAHDATEGGQAHMRAVPGSYLHEVPWVENRAAWYHRDILAALVPYCALSWSGYGIDCYAVPSVVRRFAPGRKIAVFDGVVTYHAGPGASGNNLYRGLTAYEEMLLVQAQVARDERPAPVVE
jgi:hypothetical protein